MIPVPNLDDRSWQELVDEAIRLIPKYCPEWTNHNPSDPGITLIELFAWLTEMTIYRLNKVTDKNFLAFLDLLGIDLQPPQPARALLTFDLVPGAKNYQVVVENTGVGADGGDDVDGPLVFETTRDLVVLPTKLSKCFTQFHDTYEDCTELIQGKPGKSFEAFMGCRRIERLLYVRDDNFETLSDEALLIVGLVTPDAPDSDFHQLVEWEFWNGNRWRELQRASMELPLGFVAFEGVEEMATCEVNGDEGYWIRARLVEVPTSEALTVIDHVTVRIEVIGDGVPPAHLLTQTADDLTITPDTTKNFFPLHKDPKPDAMLYLASPELFGHAGARVRIEIELADPSIADKPNASKDMRLRFEYFNGKTWQMLGLSGPEGVEDSADGLNFEDTTHAFTERGTVAFTIPDNMSETEIAGEKSYWVRARLLKGDFGISGTYELEGDRWVWKDERPLRPPVFKLLTLKYAENDRIPNQVVTYNDFRYRDISDEVRSDIGQAQVFEPIAEESPSVYMGFDQPFPNESIQVFFNVVEKTSLDLDREHADLLKDYYRKMEELFYGDKKLVWEYWTGGKWQELGVTDGTHGFTQSGFIRFLGPKDMAPIKRFEEMLFWLRVRLEMGGYEQLPHIDHILLNTVEAEHRMTLREEVLGSGSEHPNETFFFARKPVLEGEEVWVREREEPTPDEMEELRAVYGDKGVEPAEEGKGVWVRWQGVESFYASRSRSRHYRIDRISGEIQFGDGRFGMMVPKGDRNIRASIYRTGGGATGNVGPRKINILRQTIAYIDQVTNHYAAQGGSDVESVEEVKLRGPHVIKSRYRAVTKEDFEWLAMQASASIARTHCLPSHEREGEVTVLVVPKFNNDRPDYGEKLVPSTELLRRVKAYLDERRLLTVKVNVERPRYREVSMSLDVVRVQTGSGERLKRDIELALRRFLHPIQGARDQKGWPFGRNVLKVDLYQVVEQVDGVDFVDKILIFDEDRQVYVEQVKLGPNELPFLVRLDITEKARERIL